MINLDSVSFSYNSNNVIENFSININNGERLCLFGKSGCGKSTLLRLMLDLEKPDSGSILSDFTKFSVVFQENRLLPFCTIGDNIKIVGGELQKAQEYFNHLSMGDCLSKLPSDLSGGMKRRASIVRALSVDFDCLILDEPFTGLDEENIRLTSQLINDVANHKTIILVTHSKFEAEMLKAKICRI